MSIYETLKVSADDSVLHVVLNRPGARNAMNSTMLEELDRVLAEAEADESVRAVTIRGAGRVFSAGHDLKEIATRYLEGHALLPDVPQIPRPWYCSKPVVAGVHGYVGPEANRFIAACDFVIAAAGTRFSFEQNRMGSPLPIDPVIAFALPIGVVKKLWLMGGWFDAESALQWQYVQRVVSLDKLEFEVTRWAKQAALVPAERYAFAKQELRRFCAISGLVAGTEMSRPVRGKQRETFYKALLERGMRAALEYRDAAFDPEISKI